MSRRLLAFLPALMLLVGLSFVPAQASAAQPTELLRYYGDGSSATGAALANSDKCDVNGDDYEDAVVGAWFWDKAPNSNIGAAYVIFGSEDANGGSLNNPSARNAVRIDGPAVNSSFVGFAVGCLGDMNGDGFDDIAISHYTENKAYVVFGAEDFSAVDLGLLGSRGYVVKGDLATGGNVGFSLAPVGDLDEDGYDDFGVAEVVADTQGRTNNGRIWVIAGQDDIADVDLNNPAPGQILMTVDGANSEDRLGQMAAIGDVDGDGTNDFVVGAYTSVPWGPSVAVPGAAAVIWGGQSGNIDLASLGTKGFRILGPLRGRDRLGQSVSSAGDVNADGKEDLLIGADGVTNAATGNRNGSAWVVFGSASSKTVYTSAPANDTIDPGASDVNVYACDNTDPGTGTCATPADKVARGYWIKGAVLNDSAGYSLAGIGDVNADDTPDFAIGVYGYDPVNPANPPATMSGAGAVYVVYGKSDTNPQRLASLSAAEGYRIDGLAAGDRFGRQVGRLGDFDGNGTKDFFAGGDFSARPLAPGTPLSQAGEVTVALMGPLNTKTTLTSSTPPTIPGGEIDLTATVKTPAAGGNNVNQGTVAFTDGGQAIPGCAAVAVVNGSASCDDVAIPRGSHGFVASFESANANRKDSESSSIEFELVESTSTSLGSSANPVLAGNQITLTAEVEPGNGGAAVDSGTVSFTLDGVEIGDCEAVSVVDGEATCSFVPEDAGEYDLVATYSGDDSLEGSTSPTLIQIVSVPKVSVTTLSKAPSGDTLAGSDIELSAQIEVDGAPAEEGAVTFKRDGTAIPACTAVAIDESDGTADCTTQVSNRGTHTFSASYDSGTDWIADSDSTVISADTLDSTTISIESAVNPVRVGKSTTLTAFVSPAGGTVAFKSGGQVIQSCSAVVPDGGEAYCNYLPVESGNQDITAVYSGPFLVESGDGLSQTVLPPQVSAVELGKFPTTPTPIGSDITLSVQVSVDASFADAGTVTFLRSGSAIPACTAVAVDEDDGKAGCVTKAPTRGAHTFGASYDSGTISVAGSQATPIDHVATDASAISISASDTTVEVGETVTVTSTVSAANGGAPVSEGRAHIQADGCGSACDPKPVAAGKASHGITFSEPGTYALTGKFSNSQYLEDSSSAPVSVTVTKAAVKPGPGVCPRAAVTVRKGVFNKSGRTFIAKLRASVPASVRIAPRIEFKSGGKARTIRLNARSIPVGSSVRDAKFSLTRRQAKSLPPRATVVVVTRATTTGTDCKTNLGPSKTSRFTRVKTGS